MKIVVQIVDEQIGDNRVDFFVLSEIGGVKYSMMYTVHYTGYSFPEQVFFIVKLQRNCMEILLGSTRG